MKTGASLALSPLLFLVLVSPGLASERKVRLVIPDLCASNMFLIESIFKEIDGVSDVTLDVDNTAALVTFDDEKTGMEDFRKALKSRTYSISREEFIRGTP